jgi:pimeloyl-ACP methyl ester carboxylesterase
MKVRRFAIAALVVAIVAASLMLLAGPRKIVRRGLIKVERSWQILTGGLIDVGGHRLRIESSGQGGPAVVMDAGLCQPMKTWGSVPSEVAAFARVITYDRAGLGESDRGPRPRTSEQIVEELRALLRKADVRPPYVLVGHSFGGLNMRLYASRYPDEVAGLVLVDSTHEDERERYRPLLDEAERERYIEEDTENFERVDLNASAEQIRSSASLKAMPVIVLSASLQESQNARARQIAQAHREMQEKLARLTTDSKHIVVENSGHFIQLDRPDAVVGAIREVVEAVRQQSGSYASGKR